MTRPIVHLELHTPNLGRACAFYGDLLGWRPRRVRLADAAYQSLQFGAISGGVVECGTERALWLPYIEVGSVSVATERAVGLGPQSCSRRVTDPRGGGAS